VQRERNSGHAPADAPPLRAKQVGRAAQRMAHVDVGGGYRPLVLEQEGEIRSQREQQRTDQAHADGQRDAGHRGAFVRAFMRRKRYLLCGGGLLPIKVRRLGSSGPGLGARPSSLPDAAATAGLRGLPGSHPPLRTSTTWSVFLLALGDLLAGEALTCVHFLVGSALREEARKGGSPRARQRG